LFEVEADYALRAASSWIGRPDAREVVEYVREAALACVMPLEVHMTGQKQVLRFCWRMCKINAVYPDGRQEPNPFDPDGPEPWPLSEEEIKAAGFYAAVLHRLVRAAADELAGRGVPIDAEWSGDQAALACLIVMHALDFEIPWDGPIEQFAADLQPPGVSALTPDGRSVSARDGRPDALARNADRIRKLLREDQGGRELGVPYARGDHRRQPERHRHPDLDDVRPLRADRRRPAAVRARGTAGGRGARRPGQALRIHALRGLPEHQPQPGTEPRRGSPRLNARAPSPGAPRPHPRSRRHLGRPSRREYSVDETAGSPAGPEPNGHPGAVASLAVVIATGLTNAHDSGQYTTGLIALALVLIHDAVIRKR
jgi:hypothetical protein